MLKDVSHGRVIGYWIAAIIVLMACSVVENVDLNLSIGELWIIAGVVPPAVLLLVSRGAQTMAPAAVTFRS